MLRRYMVGACLFVFATLSTVTAQEERTTSKVGTTAAQFMKIGASARAIGMGGGFVAIADDISSLYWNPAGLARMPGHGEAMFTYASWLAETDYNFASAGIHLGDVGSFGFQVISFRVPEDIVRTYQFPEGTGQRFDASSLSVGLSYARALTDQFSIGFTARFLRKQIWNESASALAFDFGTVYRTPFKSLTIGAAFTNFGTKMRLDGRDLKFPADPFQEPGTVDHVVSSYDTDAFDLPLTLRIGLAYDLLNDDLLSATITTEAVHPNDNTEYVNSGVEVGIKRTLYLRGGYKSLFLQDSEQGLTFGVGLRYDAVGTNLRFDFGYADYDRLSNVQFVSFAVRY